MSHLEKFRVAYKTLRNRPTLFEFAEQHGACIRRITGDDPRHSFISWAPFDIHYGIDFERKQVVYRLCKEPVMGHLIHELGHVLATQAAPDRGCYEFDFFGWEWAVARWVGLTYRQWCYDNRDYSMENRRSWHCFEDLPRRWEHLRERIRTAQQLGLVTESLEPRVLR